MKKSIAILTTAIIVICFSSVNAYADRKTMEGILIGAGVTILGAAIISEMNTGHRSDPVYSRHHTPPTRVYVSSSHHNQSKRHKRYSHRSRGHWEVEKQWVEPVYERKWNPAHYNRRGDWVDGRFEKFMVQDGYWQEDKIWVWH
jgi:hypothetical protein